MFILLNIMLFVVYPGAVYLLVSNNWAVITLVYCISIFTLLVIRRYKKRDYVILDRSIICDDRILDILNSNLYNTYLLPMFVIKDIEKDLKSFKDASRVKGVLKKVRHHRKVRIWYKNYFNLKSLDSKIMKLAKSLNARIITVNFNLKKMSTVQKIKVVDINDLYSRLRPAVVPGNKISVFLVKDGKERNQAIGFLNDGTTVIVENAKNLIGKKADVQIISKLHTSTNKMLFGKIA
ncbi:MAG: hypothetical protein II816_03965 [Elusimicrobia bacterium]|nr:hypothetical protein [Elusimicrobiota bacterium]